MVTKNILYKIMQSVAVTYTKTG